jgi:hypothetical protein
LCHNNTDSKSQVFKNLDFAFRNPPRQRIRLGRIDYSPPSLPPSSHRRQWQNGKWQHRQQQQQQHHHIITTTTTTSKSITREEKPHFLYLKQKATRYSLSKRPSLGKKKGRKVKVKTNIPQPHSILFLTLVNFCGWETDATRFNKPGKAPKKAAVVDH